MSNTWIAQIVMEDVYLQISLSQSDKSYLRLKIINSIGSILYLATEMEEMMNFPKISKDHA